ncbi:MULTISPECIES: hypothetical protein [unclassified Rhizobium]|uniref:hypothetical protein n=1 Tax=unclassified Rhizobium TaxID=2613769 RepID=UPI000EA8A261|nr:MULTISPECIES: hypothetical protein [unclassified Rhizobium]AYG69669.1 hypothetical protein CCGE531_26395 [Rhizobium sp. CCGE531]AYG76044.1 hypothetical protein CCGE532_25880 [Rhizobium sp. CCGE532]
MIIDRAYATRIIDLVVSLDPTLNKLIEEIESIENTELSSELTRAVAEIMGRAMMGVAVPLVKILSELKHDDNGRKTCRAT